MEKSTVSNTKSTPEAEKAVLPRGRALGALRAALSTKYLERSDLVDCMLVALISGEPLIMIGPPGVAKSAICRDICRAISGNPFIWTLTKFTVPEELFGPLSLKGLEQDRYSRVTAGKLPKADVVLVNEVGKASSAISNTLLDVMNEREFFNDGKPEPIPMLTLYGTSNEVPQAEELGAFYDRFVLRCFVDSLKEDTSIRTLFKGLTQVNMPTMSVADVLALRKHAGQITVPDAIIELLIKIRRAVEQAQIFVSDRKWVQVIQVVQAMALLEERAEVAEDDLLILMHVLWSDPQQIPEVRKIVAKLVNPVNEKILEIMDGVAGLNIDETDVDKRLEVYKKLDHAKKALAKLGDPAKFKKLADAVARVEAKRIVVAKQVLE